MVSETCSATRGSASSSGSGSRPWLMGPMIRERPFRRSAELLGHARVPVTGQWRRTSAQNGKWRCMRQLLSTRAGRNVATLVGGLAVATLVGIVLLWPDGEQAIEATSTSGADAVEGEATTISEVACQAPEAETCAQVSAELLSGPDEGSTATF